MSIRKAKNFLDYISNYNFSIRDSKNFWKDQLDILSWFELPTKFNSTCFDINKNQLKWFENGLINVSYNCLDRHLETRGNKPAIIWEPDDLSDSKILTYSELHRKVCQLANLLKKYEIKKGDTIIIYLPMIPEAAISMLASSRIGAVHSVVFAGFSVQSLVDRINDCKPKLIITINEAKRGGKKIKLRENIESALKISPVEKMIVIDDPDYLALLAEANIDCAPEIMGAEDPLFILYTSGSTGKPKGIVHNSAGYLLYAAMTHEHVFDLEENDIYWSTADIGWITGHSYVVYGPLCNGATTLMFEGVPTYPNVDRYWKIIEKHKVSIFYTAPTALRSLIRYGDDVVNNIDLSSLRILGSVGEPIDPKTWEWFYKIIGKEKCHIVDTWWQTETGGIMIAPLPNVAKLKPSSAALPFYGIDLEILEDNVLAIKSSWPGMLRDVYNNNEKLIETYFKPYPGFYYSGDGSYKDDEGYYFITGRIDDVLNVAGHRLSSAEIESELEKNLLIAESAVVGFPHEIKGESIYAFVVLKNGIKSSKELEMQLIAEVRAAIGAIATIEKLQWAEQLPKTKSGKVMRRILRKIAAGEVDNFGDISTLTEQDVVKNLLLERK